MPPLCFLFSKVGRGWGGRPIRLLRCRDGGGMRDRREDRDTEAKPVMHSWEAGGTTYNRG